MNNKTITMEDVENLKLEIKTYEKEMVNIKHLFGSGGKEGILLYQNFS